MKKLTGYLFALIIALTFQNANAQQKINEGKATIEFAYPDAGATGEGLHSVLEKKGLTVYFKNGKSRAEFKDVNNTTTIFDSQKKEIVGLWAAAKTAVKGTIEEARSMEEMMFTNYTVKVTAESKDIAGYSCKKAIVAYTVYQKGSRTMDIWFTDALPGSNPVFHFKGIDGFIMGYCWTDVLYSKPEGVDFREIMTCTKVEKAAVADELFKAPADYKVTTMEEMNSEIEAEHH
jgi:GLPGLI family protein